LCPHSISGCQYSCKTVFIVPRWKITSQRPVILNCRRMSDLEITLPFHGENHNKIFFFCHRKTTTTTTTKNLLPKCAHSSNNTHSELSFLSSDYHFLLQTGRAAFDAAWTAYCIRLNEVTAKNPERMQGNTHFPQGSAPLGSSDILQLIPYQVV